MTQKVNLTIDGHEITVPAGEKVLWAALDNGIYIPNLCAVRKRERGEASCRLCFVEVEGLKRPVTACTLPAAGGMVVCTLSPRVDRLVAAAFELLLSDHRLKCSACPRNKSCELQRIARERGLKLKLSRLKFLNRKFAVDESAGSFALDRSRCVLCGRCVWVDREEARAGVLGFAGRGLGRRVTTFNDGLLADSGSTRCEQCVQACPVGALYFTKFRDTMKIFMPPRHCHRKQSEDAGFDAGDGVRYAWDNSSGDS